MRPRSCPSWCGAPSRRHAARPGDRPDQRARPGQRLPARRLERGAAGRPRRPTPASTPRCATPPRKSCAVHVQAMLDFQAMGIPTVDYGNNIRQVAFDAGVKNAFDFPGFVPAYVRPLFCRARARSAGWRCSGDPEDIRKTDAKMKELFPRRRAPAPLARHGRRAHRLPGPAGAHLLDRPGRAPPRRPGLQRDGEDGRAEGADRHRPRPPGQRLGGQRPTARPRA